MASVLAIRLKRLEAKSPPARKEKCIIRIGVEDPMVPDDQLVTIKVDVPWWPG